MASQSGGHTSQDLPSYIAVKEQVPYPYKTEVPCDQTTLLSEHLYGFLSN